MTATNVIPFSSQFSSDEDPQTIARSIIREMRCSRPRCRCAVSERRGYGLTHCPSHDDPTPSFNVTVKGDRLLVCCEAGCQQDHVVEVLKHRGFWTTKVQYKDRIEVAVYDYTDGDGKLLYQSIRYFPKDFRQRRPAESGTGFEWNLNGTPRVLYRLKELRENRSKPIFIVEGEKDVERLRALGLIATCNTGGAGKWNPEYAKEFAGCQVIIVPDNDESGRQHSLSVAASLKDIAKSVRWMELPGVQAKGDVSDWLDDHDDDVEQLKALARAAPIPPSDQKRQSGFNREGMAWRYEPEKAAVIMRFSRIADHREETTAELWATRPDGTHILRRRVNLLAGSGTTWKSVIEDLSGESLGLDIDWPKILKDGFELVLNAVRSGIVVETISGQPSRPSAPSWLCDGLVLKEKMNCWLGSAGTGKSTLAKAFCVYHATGYKFLGLDTEQGVPAYLDWEDDKDDLVRVTLDVCQNLSVPIVPDIHWIGMRGKRLRDNIEYLARKIDELGITLLVLDAIAAAGGSPGEFMSWEAVALELEACLGLLPPVTVLGLDHVTSQEHKNSAVTVPTKARGSERKVEFVRNQWTLMLDHDEMEYGNHVVSWTHTKINSGVRRPPFVTKIIHRPDELSIDIQGIAASQNAVQRLSRQQQVELFVKQTPGMTTAAIASQVYDTNDKSKVDATYKQLHRAREHGRITVDAAGRWWPADMDSESRDSDDEQAPAASPYVDLPF